MLTKNLIVLLLLALSIISFSRPGAAELSVGGAIGGNFSSISPRPTSTLTSDVLQELRTVDASLLLGINLEYYFVDKGFLKCPWPDWMKNISMAFDLTYNTFKIGNPPYGMVNRNGGWETITMPNFNGDAVALSFLLKYRFPLIKQENFQDGRLFFYLGAGPGLTISVLRVDGHRTNSAATFVGETGFSLFIVKDVSTDLFFRYRYSSPAYLFQTDFGPPTRLRFTDDSFSAGIRIAFHF